uniref:Adrenodoxin-NADP(+) reductase n=1 Tax=Soboliphyme baturini TaxID=241478 RepID=A0A183J803_9BILA
LRIIGDEAIGCFSASDFVGWYNGHPKYANVDPDLQSTDTAVVLGHGNVALDIARMLLSSTEHLAHTDISARAYAALLKSRIRRVILAGRRGPLQISITTAELREMSRLPGVFVEIARSDLESTIPFLGQLQRPRRRLTELMLQLSQLPVPPPQTVNLCSLRFLLSATEILSISKHVTGVKFIQNRLRMSSADDFSSAIAEPTPETQTIACGIVVCSFGRQSLDISNGLLPFNLQKSIVSTAEDGTVIGCPTVYACGWCSLGSTGVLLKTQQNARAVAESLIDHYSAKPVVCIDKEKHPDAIEVELRRKSYFTDWQDWKCIDAQYAPL